MEAKSVVVIQDASNEVNTKVLEWGMRGFGLQPRDKLTLVAVLHQITTPMGYLISLDKKSLTSANGRIIEQEVASKKKMYQERLAEIAEHYESTQVEFKIKVVVGSSLKDVALKKAIDLKATWLILDRQMKKDEEFLLCKLSCGMSRLKRNNMIKHLRGHREMNNSNIMGSNARQSSETCDEGYPSPSPEIRKSETDDEQPIQDVEPSSLNDGDRKSPDMNGNNKTIGQIESEQSSLGIEEIPNNIHNEESELRLETDSDQIKGEINGDQGSRENEHIQSSPCDEDKNSKTPIINSNQTNETSSGQPSTEKRLQGSSLHDRTLEENSSHVEEQAKDYLPRQNEEKTESVLHVDFPEKKREKSILENLENSKRCICSVCKNIRPNIQWQKDFTYQELEAATEGFSVKNSLSECVLGSTFKGQIEGKLKIVIKQHRIADAQVLGKIKSEIELIIKARHKNVVILLGSLTHESHLLIVYEQACNGSLDKYLSSGSPRPLTWKERMKIAVGVSRGLKHLHENNIIHGSMKPSNILLTHDFEPLLGDFNFRKAKLESKWYYKDKKLENSGYAAPEYLEGRRLSVKSDVYSFGVVLLELISGRRATDKISKGKNLVEWAKSNFGGNKCSQLVDPKIGSSYEEDQLKWLVQVIENCLKKNPKDRYSMNMVVSALQDMAESGKGSEMEGCSLPNSGLTCSVPDITVIQDNDEENPRSIYCDTKNPKEMICNNHVMMKRKDGQPSHVEEQIERRLHVEENSLRLRISHDGIIDWKKSDQLRQDQEEIRGGFIQNGGSLRLESTDKSPTKPDKQKMQTSSHGDLPEGYQGGMNLENSKFSLCSICKCRRPNSGWARDFSYRELQAATEEFSIKNSLSEHGYGPAFRGQLRTKLKIVIKRHQITKPQGEKEFKSQIQLLAEIRHENVIMLLGSCIQDTQLLIVNEHACSGSLEQYLSKGSRVLSWGERVKIAIGACRGLKYLHDNNIIHGSMKPSNILLTHDFRALLADFGFGKAKQQFFHTDENVANAEYTAPESVGNGKLSSKADIYSLGVILLELISGRRVTEKIPGHKSLVGWAGSLLKKPKYTQLVDSKIGSAYDEEQLASLAHVIENCLKKKPKERLSMPVIVSELQYEVDNKEIYVLEDSPPKISDLTGCTSGFTSSQGNEEPLAKNLGAEVFYQEEQNYITYSISNMEIKINQESEKHITCGGSEKDMKIGQESENYITHCRSNKGTEISQESENRIICTGNSEEKKISQTCKDDITFGGSNKERHEEESTKEYQKSEICICYGKKCEDDITFGGSNKEGHEEESLSTKEYQKSEIYKSNRSARDFFLGGAKEYIVDERFFSLPN